MSTTYPNMSLQLPVRGNTGAGVWGDTLDADIALIDAHDHSPGKGKLVPINGLDVNADMSFGSLYAPVNLHRVQFSEIAVASITAGRRKSLFVSDGTGGLVQHELYFQSNAGASVQITNGSALNVGAFVGGFTGEFTAVGAVATYTNSSKIYTFETGTGDGNGWARAMTGGVRIGVLNDTNLGHYVEHAVAGAIAGSYTVTWPAALPATKSLLTVTSSGVIGTAPSALPSVASSAPISIDTSGTVGFSATYTLTVPLKGILSGSSPSAVSIASGATDPAIFPFTLPLGARILRTRAVLSDNVTGPSTFKVGLMTWNGTTASASGFGTASAGTGATQTITSAVLASDVVSGSSYYVEVTVNAGTSAGSIKAIEVDYNYN